MKSDNLDITSDRMKASRYRLPFATHMSAWPEFTTRLLLHLADLVYTSQYSHKLRQHLPLSYLPQSGLESSIIHATNFVHTDTKCIFRV